MQCNSRPDIVKFLDLGWQTDQVRDEVEASWRTELENSSFILSPAVSDFEQAFATFSGTNFCVGVGNGTDALEIALRAVGVGLGDEVIVPANSFVASAIAVTRCGAIPVFVDCLPETWLIDVSQVEQLVGPRTKAIMPVHLYGQMVDMAALMAIASAHDLFIVEDMAQAQGASQDGRPAGSLGIAAGTSFYPGKNLGAMGDAGALLTGSQIVFEQAVALRNYGSPIKYEHPVFGFNSRLDSLQAAVLLAKLKRLQSWNGLRAQQALAYQEALAGVDGLGLPAVSPGNLAVWHLFVVQVEKRFQVMEFLKEQGIETGIHYPTPIHLLGMYKDLGYAKGAFPVAELAAEKSLSLPIYPGLSEESQQRVVEALKKALAVT